MLDDSEVVALLFGLVFLLILRLMSTSLVCQSAESQRETASRTIDLIKLTYLFKFSTSILLFS